MSFIEEWNVVADDCLAIQVEKGFEELTNDGERLALIHAEVSEVLEALRKKKPERSEKIPEFYETEEELADVAIRLMNFANARAYRLPEAILAKMAYNRTRQYKHGKRF